MRKSDTSDVITSLVAVIMDGLAVFGGFLTATWIRFDSGWIPVIRGRPEGLYALYSIGAVAATALFLMVFQSLHLYRRPQTGTFYSKIPRLIKASSIGILMTVVLAYAAKNEADFSSVSILIAWPVILVTVLLERYIMFRIEWNMARHSNAKNNVLIIGTDVVAARIRKSIEKEPMLRSKVTAFLRVGAEQTDDDIPQAMILGDIGDLPALIPACKIDQVIVSACDLPHARLLEIIMICERNLATFNMVPDLFRIMTTSMDVQTLNDIPLLGINRWPLDIFWNRLLKRMEDLGGSVLGLLLFAPLIAVSCLIVWLTSGRPVLYAQERCGQNGKSFMLFKIRTMRHNAESTTGPVFTRPDDPRTTRVGAFLRRYNIDELPQFWNVFRGDMSLVGPRPERPFFVEKFRDDVSRYMSRHVSKPGMTGWAQVNGLRGDTSIEERIKYDLYYLENWSLAFDFKIIARTVFARENAY